MTKKTDDIDPIEDMNEELEIVSPSIVEPEEEFPEDDTNVELEEEDDEEDISVHEDSRSAENTLDESDQLATEDESFNEDVFVFPVQKTVATISLDQLRRSAKVLKAGTNNPGKTRPVQSWEFIDQIMVLLAKNNVAMGVENIPVLIDQLYVNRKFSSRILTKDQEELFDETNTPIEHWVFNHVVGKLVLGIPNEEYNPAIAFSFNKNGISVAYGISVWACSNLSIFGEYVMSTYGKEALPFSKLMVILEFWITNMQQIYEKNIGIIGQMKEGMLDEHAVYYEIGKLYVDAIKKAYVESSFPAVMNTYQLSVIVQEYLTTTKTDEYMSIWDFYNLGTGVIKSENVGAEDILQANKRWTDYVIENVFPIEYPGGGSDRG